MVTPLSAIRKFRYDYWPRLRSLALNALVPRKTVYSRGLKFTLGCENWITEYRWREFNKKEPETLDWIDQYIQNGSVFLSVGANVGVFSIYSALRHPRLSVIAVEPEYSNLHLLRDNVLANGLQERVSIFSVALGNENHISYLRIQDATPGAALHTISRQNLERTYEGKKVIWKEGVKTMTMDRFLSEIGLKPNFIKIDVDGTEDEVLAGGRQTLFSPELCSIIIEIPKDREMGAQCKKMLAEAGLRNVSGTETKWNQTWIREG